jgi:hypothetical protein
MTFWVPRPERALAAALILAGMGVAAKPADAIPFVDVGADVGAAFHWSGGPALDLTGDVNLRGLVISGQYWTQLGGPSNYITGGLRYNVSPVPMLRVEPGIGLASLNGGFGPAVNAYAAFSPILLPAAVEAGAGAAFVGGGTLYPYFAGVKLSLFPFTAFNLRYRGWGGAPGALLGGGGPEIGFQIGI